MLSKDVENKVGNLGNILEIKQPIWKIIIKKQTKKNENFKKSHENMSPSKRTL